MSMVDNFELDFVTDSNHLQAVIQDFLDKAERLAHAAGQQTELKLKEPDTNQPLKPLQKKWDRDAARAYQKFLSDAANKLSEVMKHSEAARQLKPELDKLCALLDVSLNLLAILYSPLPATEARLFQSEPLEAIPTGSPIVSSVFAQLRKDLWKQDDSGIAYLHYKAKSNQNNYIEHYITSPGDVTLLPWVQAEQIIDKFGPNTVKLQFIFAAHTMKQPVPWESSFTLKATDLVKELGWDRGHNSCLSNRLNEVAQLAFTLDCLLVRAVWIEGKGNGKVDASAPTGRMWNVLVDPRQDNVDFSQLNLFELIDKPTEFYITVQPGLWTKHYLNKAGCKAKEALYQFGYIAQDILRLDPYHDWLAFKLMSYLYPASKYHPTGEYRVKTLLEVALSIPEIEISRQDKRKGYDLKQRWDNFLKLLIQLQNPWLIEFDSETYPESLRPGSKERMPKGYLDRLLNAKITIKPPAPIPNLIAAKVEPKPRKLQPALVGLTPDQIRRGREARGWNQRELAGFMNVSKSLVGYWEKGERTPTPEHEVRLRKLLNI